MTVENSSGGIWLLDEDLPLFDDPIGEAQVHLNNIKAALQNSFKSPIAGSNPVVYETWNGPINISSAKLSSLSSILDINSTAGTPPAEDTINYVTIDGLLRFSAYDNIAAKKVFYINKVDKKLSYEHFTVPLGSIIYTFLSTVQLDSLYGVGKFQICDGAQIPVASLLRTIFGSGSSRFTNTPNLKDRIASMTIADSEIGWTYGHSTRWEDGKDFSNLTNLNYSHNHGGFSHNSAHFARFDTGGYALPGADLNSHGSSSYGALPPGYIYPKWYSTLDNGIKAAFNHAHNVNTFLPAGKSNGKNFPNRVVVNAYMRVN